MLSHSAVLRLWRLELTLQSLSLVLALYDPFGVDVPLNFDNTQSLTQLSYKCTRSKHETFTAVNTRTLPSIWDLNQSKPKLLYIFLFCPGAPSQGQAHPDYVPTVFAHIKASMRSRDSGDSAKSRFQRAQKRLGEMKWNVE